MGEFELIEHYFARPCRSDDVLLGIGDDAAMLQLPPGEGLLVSTDMLVAGRHFPEHTAPADIGYKALAVNLSDLAAMGARPIGFTLSLGLPAELAGPDWLAPFAEGLRGLAVEHGVCLVGGDTVAAPRLTLSVTALGAAPPDRVLRRNGARPGDLIAVTGTLGDAGLGLRTVLTPETVPAMLSDVECTFLRGRLDRPTPRLAIGRALAGRAHAAIDISDGLVQDLGHVLKASGVGARIDCDRLPLSAATRRWIESDPGVARAPLTAGDDYELLFTIAPGEWDALDLPATVIGEIMAEPGLVLVDGQGYPVEPGEGGFDHFRSPSA